MRHFYRRAYSALIEVARPGTHIVFSDGFVPRLLSGAVTEKQDYLVVMDVHWYQFGFTKLERYFKKLGHRHKTIAALERRQPVIIGEWSGVLSHETLSTYSRQERDAFQKRHLLEQQNVYDTAAGWFYWTYKTESPGIWNFRSLLTDGKIALNKD